VVEDSRFATVNIRFSLLALKRDIMWAEVRNLLLTFLMMILGFFGAIWLAKNVTHPIEELTRAMARVAKGDLGVSAPVVSKDEIGLLTESFNLMVQDLKEKVRIKDAFDVWPTNSRSQQGQRSVPNLHHQGSPGAFHRLPCPGAAKRRRHPPVCDLVVR